jgi:protein-tyrosine kinase
MSIIEKAAERLEQLRRAGVETPPAAAEGSAVSTPNAAAEPAGAVEPRYAMNYASATSTLPAIAPPAIVQPKEEPQRSKTVEIDVGMLAAAGYVTPESQRTQLAEEFRVIKRPIINNALATGEASVARANCVMVTSAVPSEGKSFVALNLALSIASEVDSTVLLVDADVANPNLMRRMHLPASNGLLDVLTDRSVKLSDVLLRTNVEKLSLLAAGSPQRRATEVLASSAMADLVEEMATRYPDRILVFDSPPLIPTTEARVLASHMGQIIMVVEADVTTQVVVQQALETIASCPIVLMVLNKATRRKVGGYYGYGGYGRYGYGGHSGYSGYAPTP